MGKLKLDKRYFKKEEKEKEIVSQYVEYLKENLIPAKEYIRLFLVDDYEIDKSISYFVALAHFLINNHISINQIKEINIVDDENNSGNYGTFLDYIVENKRYSYILEFKKKKGIWKIKTIDYSSEP